MTENNWMPVTEAPTAGPGPAVLPLGAAPLGRSTPPEQPETAIAKSIKEHLLEILKKPLTVARAVECGRVLAAGVKVLKATTPGVAGLLPAIGRRASPYGGFYPGGMLASPGGDGIDDFESDNGGVLAPAMQPETMGNTVVRDFLTSIQKVVEEKGKASVGDLVEAISIAKKEGLTEETELLRAQLRERTGGKKLTLNEVDAAVKGAGAAFGGMQSGLLSVPSAGASIPVVPVSNFPGPDVAAIGPEIVLNPAGGSY